MNQQNNQPVRRSRRLANIIPASHWISIGYSEDDAQALEKLQNDMKTISEEGNDITDNDTDIKLRRDGDMLHHHEWMLPHWQKFAKSLSGRTTSVNIQIKSISIPVTVLDIVLPTFQSINLTTLRFSRCGFGSDEYLYLSSFLKQNTSLIGLQLGGYAIDEMSVASSLSDAIESHPSLYTVLFSACGCSNNAVLKRILDGCGSVKVLGIMQDNLGSDAIALLADFIRSNHSIVVLKLQRNNISSNDTALLASALKTNTHLEELDLRHNVITEEGDKILLKAIYDPTSMDSITESNHICIPHTFDITQPKFKRQPPFIKEVYRINDDDISIQQKIRKKAVLALCRVEGEIFDLSHLNNLPLQLMPRVLELIQEHSQSRKKAVKSTLDQLEKDALSRLFHTLRGWELPLLFNNLRTQVPTGKRKRRKTCRYH